MTLRLVLPALLALAAFAEQIPNPIIGTVEKTADRTLQVRSGRQLLTLSSDESTIVTKSGTFHDLSPLKKGEQVRVSWRGDRMAIKIDTEVVFSGLVQISKSGYIEVRNTATNEVRNAQFTRDTKFGTYSPDLPVGQEVHITGWDTGDGWIEASRVAIYNTDVPADIR